MGEVRHHERVLADRFAHQLCIVNELVLGVVAYERTDRTRIGESAELRRQRFDRFCKLFGVLKAVFRIARECFGE